MLTTILLSSNTAWSLHNFRGGLIKAYLERGNRVFIVAPEDAYSAKLASMGCEVLNINIDNVGTNPWHDLRTYFSFRFKYRHIRPDIVLHYTIKPVIYGTLAAKSLGIPCINTVSGLGTAFIRENFLTRIVEWLYRISQVGATKVVFLNPDDLRLFVGRKLIAQNQAELLLGEGVDLLHFGPVPLPSKGAPVFLLMARMLWAKGVGEFVEAARQVISKYPDARFQLLGPLGVANRTAVSRTQMEAWVKEAIVEYLGETEDVRPFLRNADCIVLPSYYREGVPVSLLEAAASGRAVIATDEPGCREVVENGVNGFLCRAKDPASLAEQMERFIAMPPEARAEMGHNARKKVEQQFDRDAVIQRYLQVVAETLREKKMTR